MTDIRGFSVYFSGRARYSGSADGYPPSPVLPGDIKPLRKTSQLPERFDHGESDTGTTGTAEEPPSIPYSGAAFSPLFKQVIERFPLFFHPREPGKDRFGIGPRILPGFCKDSRTF